VHPFFYIAFVKIKVGTSLVKLRPRASMLYNLYTHISEGRIHRYISKSFYPFPCFLLKHNTRTCLSTRFNEFFLTHVVFCVFSSSFKFLSLISAFVLLYIFHLFIRLEKGNILMAVYERIFYLNFLKAYSRYDWHKIYICYIH